jgi:hypothetical protein
MRLGVAVELEVALSDLAGLRQGAGASIQSTWPESTRGGSGVGLRHRQHHHPIDLWHALGIPVGFVGNDLETLARRRTWPS